MVMVIAIVILYKLEWEAGTEVSYRIAVFQLLIVIVVVLLPTKEIK